MKILVLGSTGTLGSELVCRLREKFAQHEVIEVTHSQVDFSDFKAAEKYIKKEDSKGKIGYIVNCAALVNMVGTESTFDVRNKSFKANVLIPKYLAFLSKKYDIKLIHFSTDFVFSEHSEKSIENEYDEFPVSIYGYHKLLGEMYIEKYLDVSEFLCFRVGWIYGYKTKRSFIHKFLKNIVDTQKRTGKKDCDVTVVADQISTPTSVQFICDGVVDAIHLGFMGGVNALCPKGSVTKYNYAVKILEMVKQLYGIDAFDDVKIVKTETHQNDIAYPLDSRLEKHCKKCMITNVTWQKDLKEYMTMYSAEFKNFIEDILNV